MVKPTHRTSTSISSSRGRRRARETRGPMMMSMTMTTRSGTSSTRRRRSSARTLARASPCVVHIARASSSDRNASSSSSSRRMKTRRGVRDGTRFDSTLHPYETRARRRDAIDRVRRPLYHSIVTLIIVTGVLGASPASVGARSIASTISMPSTTRPNTGC